MQIPSEVKVGLIGGVSVLQSFAEIINPLLGIVISCLTIRYIYLKTKNLKK